MWCVTYRAAFCLQWCVFVSEWTLLVGVALHARRIRAGGQSCLLELETAVGIVTVAALHRAFEHLVMKGLVEVGLNFVVTTDAELRLAGFQQMKGRKIGLFCVGCAGKGERLRDVSIAGERMR